MRVYDIHNLISLRVEDNVSEQIIESIEFKYGFFRCLDGKIKRDVPALIVNQFNEVKNLDLSDCLISSKTYYKNSKFIVDFNQNVGIVMEDANIIFYTDEKNYIDIFIQILLLRLNFTFLHASATMLGSDISILSGLGGIGKTQFALELIKERNHLFFGDDLIIVGSDGKIYSFPKPLMLKKQHQQTMSSTKSLLFRFKLTFRKIRSHIIIFLKDNIPFSGLIKRFLKRRNPASRMVYRSLSFDAANFTPLKVQENAKINVGKSFSGNVKLLLVERTSSGFREDESHGALQDKLLNIVLNEFKSQFDILGLLGISGMYSFEKFGAETSDCLKLFCEHVIYSKHAHIPLGGSHDDYISIVMKEFNDKKET